MKQISIVQRIIQSLCVKHPDEVINGIIHKSTLDESQRTKLIRFLLLNAADEQQELIVKWLTMVPQLNVDQQLRLLKHLLRKYAGEQQLETVVNWLITTAKLTDQQQIRLQKRLLSGEVNPRQTNDILQWLTTNAQLTGTQKQTLYTSVFQQPIPSMAFNGMLDSMQAENHMVADQREKMLQIILQKPVNTTQREMMLESLVKCENDKQLAQYDERFRCVMDTISTFERLSPWLNVDRMPLEQMRAIAIAKAATGLEQTKDILMDLICEDNICYLNNAEIEFLSRRSLWTMIMELLLNEDYYAELDSDKPCVVDCGVNIGLAIYYFKERYPNSRIIGFEPVAQIYETACRNVDRNHWQDVTLHQCALNDRNGTASMHVVGSNDIACTLTGRMNEIQLRDEGEIKLADVPCRMLGDFIEDKVDYLKMDIEGVELKVLRSLGDSLSKVENLFVEYHCGPGVEDNELSQILLLLDQNGFVYNVSASVSYAKGIETRPMRYVGRRFSSLIWGRKKQESDNIEQK